MRSILLRNDFFESLFIAKSEIELTVIKKKTMTNDILNRFSPIGLCLKLIALLISFTCLYVFEQDNFEESTDDIDCIFISNYND